MENVLRILESPRKTLLCVGALSANIVEAAADVSEQYQLPVVLIASRRQVDAAELGGGYANNWSTENFASAVRALGRGQLYVGRDHGGPGQGSYEMGQKPDRWMSVAQSSFAVDIECGLSFLHLDTSAVFPGESYCREKSISRLLELYGYVQEVAHLKGKRVAIEVGIEKHSGLPPNLDFLHHFLENVQAFCRQQRFPMPLFVVAQTGARVEEMRNVGVFDEAPSEEERREIIDLICEATAITRTFGCFLKEHNADYLSATSLALRPHLGIKAINVAPEFGVSETKSLLRLMQDLGCRREFAEFQDIVIASKKWEKWLAEPRLASDIDCTMMAGHYCFSDPRVQDIKARVASVASKKGIVLEAHLRKDISSAMLRFVSALEAGYRA